MTDRPLSEMSREELQEEARLLRAALERLGSEITSADILRADQDRDAPVLDKLTRFKGRLPADERLSRDEANQRDGDR